MFQDAAILEYFKVLRDGNFLYRTFKTLYEHNGRCLKKTFCIRGVLVSEVCFCLSLMSP